MPLKNSEVITTPSLRYPKVKTKRCSAVCCTTLSFFGQLSGIFGLAHFHHTTHKYKTIEQMIMLYYIVAPSRSHLHWLASTGSPNILAVRIYVAATQGEPPPPPVLGGGPRRIMSAISLPKHCYALGGRSDGSPHTSRWGTEALSLTPKYWFTLQQSSIPCWAFLYSETELNVYPRMYAQILHCMFVFTISSSFLKAFRA